jgi:hypothetical protein
VDWLRRGGIVVLPTDTFYGLAVDPASDAAVAALFDLKGRSPRAALPLVGASAAQIERWCGMSTSASRRLAAAFWPGPLSLVFDAPARAVAVHGGGRGCRARPRRCRGARLAGRHTDHGHEREPERRATSQEAVRSCQTTIDEVAGHQVETIECLAVDGKLHPVQAVFVREGAVPWNRVLESLQG